MSKTAKKTLLLIALLTSVSAFAQTSVRDLVPSSAPAGARVMVTGRGLADPALAVAFAPGATAAVVQRHDRYIEVVVPANAATGNVRVTNGAALVAELPFTVTATPKYLVTTHAGGKSSKNTPLKHPWGAAVVLPEGTVAVADEQHHRILLVTAAGPTTVLAGGNKQGFTNGKGAAAEFKSPRGIAFDAARRVLYVSDTGNAAIREVALDGTVKTLAGSGKQGFADGTGAAAEFRDPHGLSGGADGAIYVTDPKNFRIRRVTTAGVVTTFAGNGQRGTAVGDGALLSATFNEPRGIVAAGNDFYVADTKNNAIRKISGGQVTSVLSFPRTGDDDDPADGGDGNANVLDRPAGIGVDESGFLVVSDSENDFIRRIDPRTTPAAMITIAGTGKNGWVDGDGAVAQFKDPVGLTVAGAIYVADEDNDALRRLCPEVRLTGLYSPSGAVTAGTEVRLFGTGFVPGLTTVQIGGVAATGVIWISSTELAVKLPQNITGGTVSVTIVSCAGTAGPVSFVVDNTAPVITVTQGGSPLVDGALFRVPVTPVIAVTDDLDPAPRVTITLNGAPFVSGTTVSVDAFYTLVVTAEDAAGNRAERTVKFVVLTAPASLVILEGTTPLHPDSLFNRAVILDTAFTGFLNPTVVMQIDGQPYTAKTPYSVEGTHSVTARATDSVGGDITAGPIPFTIDLTPPALTFTSHTNNQVLSSRDLTVIGGSDDAVTVSVNGVAATVDTTAKTFTLPVSLVEGENTLVATGTDRAGNTGTATLKLRLDSRAPELTVTEVAACVRTESLELRGTVADPALDKVVVKLDGTTTNAVVTGGAWSATIALPAEGSKSILVEATDSTGHVATEQVTVTVDRTAPQIELSESGGAFTATLVPRPVALFVRSNETSATVTATLGTTAYASGTEIAAEGSHTIRVTARDCAGNESSREHSFAIDLTPPRFLTFTPASGTKVSAVPGSLSGTVSDDAVEVHARGITVPATNGAFTIPNIGFTDGVNDLSLDVVDRAGHTGRGSYTIGIRTSQPLVDIVEGGEAMVNGTVYRRTVEPRVRVFEDGVTFTATLNGAPFTNGTAVSANGQYTISATATDPAFNQSSSITRTFTIDRSGPEVVIVSPADGASIDAGRTDVRVTAGDSVRVVINTVAATRGGDNVWTANVPLDIGENVIVATGTDAAGNSGSDSADVTRGTAGPAIVLTFPPDNHVTNRPRLDVTGRVLRPNSSVAVTVPPAGAASAAVDPAGMFRLSGAELREGEWTITAVATEGGGKSTSAAVRVIADFTPPRVRILESGSPLADSAHFPTQAVITGDATDKGQPVNYSLVVDGNPVTSGVTISATGGHTAVITATDAAGNQARLERTFYVGSSAGGGCLLEVESFDPRHGTVLNAQKVELIGRSGGAAGVKANGVAAKMSNGSFCVPVELPQEGANTVTVVCTDAAGNPTGDPKVITLYRATNDPSVTITTPAEDSVSQDETIVVTGTLGNGAVSVDVNGKPATINGSNWTVTDVRLQDGVNVLVAHAKNASGRAASASRRVTYLQELPAIAISSPIAGFVTGRSRTDVSGTFSNVVPTSIAVTGVAGAVTPEAWSDTTGRFVGRDVPLQTGDNTIVVTGLDRTGRIARAEVVVRHTPNLPLIDITSPADNHYYGGAQGNTFRVEGTFTAAAGSSVDVNGVAATISGTTFSADVPFSNLPGGLTPVIARVAQPSGDDGAFDSLRVFKLAEAPKVLSVFPPANEIEVNPGAVVLVLFSAPMERASTVDAFRLENAAGTALGGKVYLDKDVLTFAPGTTLTAGERYTIKVAGSAKDLAGQSLTPAHETSFVVATTAPGTAPVLTTKSGAYCGNTIDVAGTAAPGARLRLDYGQVFFTTTATPSGTFSYKIALSGQQGFHVIRVRTIGGDGTLSPFVELKLNVDCAGPRVLGATYDRNVNTLTIVFNRDVKPETVNASTVLIERADGTLAGGTIVTTGANAVVTPSPTLAESTFTLKVTTGVQDTAGRNLELPHTQLFPFGDEQPQPGDGRGYITGEVYDATTGRPLAGAAITIEAPAAAFARGVATNATAATQAVTMIADARGRYSDRFPEGAHTIKASANGYTTVWRQIIVPAGAGVIPIDIRLTRRGTSLVHGGDKVARRAELALAGAGTATITSTGAQSLAGLLPLGWSPLASAVISTNDTITGQLTCDVPQSELTQHAQSLTAVRYDDSRDEWRVLVPVVNVNGNKATFDVSSAGAYALVYADRAPKLKTPPVPVTGAVLQGAADPCATGACPELIATSFPLDPAVVLPSESTVATLNIRGTDPHLFPSGTAVQAYIDEELRLVDGGRELDPPFATDLLLYRNLAGDLGVAAFNLAPSPRAAEVTLEVGFDHIRILPYPGRLDRGTLVGPEGGRVPADEKVSVEIPTGATQGELRATATSIVEAQSLGPIAGFTIVGGLNLSLQQAATTPDLDGDGKPDAPAPVELTRPARATFSLTAQQAALGKQFVLVELLDRTPFGQRLFRLAAEMQPLDATRWTTKSIDREQLPVDGIVREGRYLLLAANAPTAFAKGIVRLGAGGPAAADARVTTPAPGVADLSRLTGIFNVAVPATPATPFQLTPRSATLGDGATYTHTSSPAANAIVNVGDLLIVAQPPQIASTIPAANATNVNPATTVEVTLTPGIDATSVNATTLSVIDTTTGTTVAGTVTAVGNLGVRWTMPSGNSLRAGTRYTVAVAPSLRGTNGTPLGQAHTFSFTTASVVTSNELHPERIHITIPDANGTSRITGLAGALKTGWLAVPVRRNRDFLTRYSVVANADGSFALTIGTDPRDRLTIADEIDLRVLNNAGALAAIIPLTPFVSEDGKGFVVSKGRAATFTSVDNITITVPEGAFDKATLVEVRPSSPAVFAAVPRITTELLIGASIEVKFDGRALKPLELSFPTPAGADTNLPFMLALLGQSSRGPRLQAVDTMVSANGKLSTGSQRGATVTNIRTNSVGTNEIVRSNDPRDFLMRFIEAGQYAVAQMRPEHGTMAWSLLNTAATINELHWDTLHSMYVGHEFMAESLGRVAFPVPANTNFTVTAIDPTSSLIAFEHTYEGLPVGPPGSGAVISAPNTDFNGPHPVYATPFRVESVEAPPAGNTLQALRDVELALDTAKNLTISGTGSMTAATQVSALNVDSGELRGPTPLPITLPNTNPGDRIILTLDEENVDPASEVSVVFNESLEIDGTTAEEISDALKSHLEFKQKDNGGGPDIDLLQYATLRLDASGRRIIVGLGSPLARGAKFRLTLKETLRDRSGNNLGLGQIGEQSSTGGVTPAGPNPQPMILRFETRDAHGEMGSFTLRQRAGAEFGAVREIAQYDNLMFVAALDGGILAYDLSDPGALNDAVAGSGPQAKPIAIAPGRDSDSYNPITDYWSLQIDHHGRIFAVGTTNMFGAFRSFRVEDFVKASTQTSGGCLPTMPNTVCKQSGGAIISQLPGTSYTNGLPSQVVTTDRAEATPRKIKVVVGDAAPVDYTRDTIISAFGSGSTAVGNAGLHQFNLQIPASGTAYRLQRITVQNVTLGLRWSADAKAESDAIGLTPAKIEKVIAGPNDVLRVTHNRTTHAVITLFGFGIGVFDVNAIESNELPQFSGGGEQPIEQVALRRKASDGPAATSADSIGDLSFSPDSEIVGVNDGSLHVYTLDSRKGVADFSFTPPGAPTMAGQLVFPSDARWSALKSAVAGVNAAAFGRFNQIAQFQSTDGRDWILLPNLGYGLLIVEAGPAPLSDASFADVIWHPRGAYAVRAIPGSNLAVILDREGYAHLVDLSRIDERQIDGTPTVGLFPTAAAAIAANAPDPRILWTSDDPVAGGSGFIPPIVDPETGFMVSAELLTRKMRVHSIIDPRLWITADVGDPRGPQSVGSVVPLGVEPPDGILPCSVAASDCRASLGVFRVEARLPGSMVESTIAPLDVAIESEAVPGADTPQTPEPYPPAHLRFQDRSSNVDTRFTGDKVTLKRTLDVTSIPELRYQKGWNRFASDWIVAIADPRASKEYVWPSSADKEAAGCYSCDRPDYLNATGVDSHEIYTAGRLLSIRPEFSSAGGYAFMKEKKRLTTRVSTVRGDLVRPSDAVSPLDKVAAKNLPTAGAADEGPVNLNTGEVTQSAVDLAIQGRGLDFVMQRHYSSAIAHVGPFGRNFDSPLFARLQYMHNGNVIFFDGTGRRDVFTGGTTPPEGVFLDMRRDSFGNIAVHYPDNTRMHFDGFGRLAKIVDRNATKTDGSDGNTMTFMYDGFGRLAAVVDPTGNRPVFLEYYNSGSCKGCVSKVRDYDGREVKYFYDASARLERVEGPDPASASSAMPSTTYTWGPAATVATKAQLYASGQIESEKDGLSRTVWSVGYDGTNRWAAKTLTSGGGTWTFTLTPASTDVLNPNGHTFKHARDDDSRITGFTEPGGAITTYGFDGEGRLASVKRPMGDETRYGYSGGAGRRSMLNVGTITEVPRAGSPERVANMTRVTSIGYGPANLPTSIQYPDNSQTIIERDGRGNPKKIVDGEGVVTTTVYDDHGLLKSSSDPRLGSSTFGYETAGVKTGYLKTATKPDGVTQYGTDTRGNRTSLVDPTGRSMTYTVNKLDQIERFQHGASQRAFTFNAARQPVNDSELVADDPATGPVYNTTTYTVDAVGRVRTTLKNGITRQYGYDGAGNVTSSTSPVEPLTTYGYDARNRLTTITEGSRVTTYVHDDGDAIVSMTDPRGHTTVFSVSGFNDEASATNSMGVVRVESHDVRGRSVDTRIMKVPATGSIELMRWNTREYDRAGRMVKDVRKLFTDPLVIPPTGDPVGATDVVTTYEYDDDRRTVTEIDPRGGRSVVEHDKLERPVKITDPAGNVLERTYLPNGKVGTETLTEVGPNGARQITKRAFHYDRENRLAEAVDESDPARRLVRSYVRDMRGNVVREIDPAGRVTTFAYDVRGNKTSQVDADGAQTRFEYDSDTNRLMAVVDPRGARTEYTYDTFGNVATERRPGGATWTYGYDANNNLATVTDPNGTVTTHEYDADDRWIGYAIARGAGVGGATSVTVTLDGAGRPIATATNEGVKTFHTWDSLDRELLTEVQIGPGPRRTIGRFFDSTGNVTGVTYPSGLDLTYERDPVGQIASIRQAGAIDPIVRYGYIGERILSKATSNGTEQTRSYDPYRRVTELIDRVSGTALRHSEYERSTAGDKAKVTRPALGTFDTFAYNAKSWIVEEKLRTPLDPAIVDPTPQGVTLYDPDRNLNYDSIMTYRANPAGTAVEEITTTADARNQYTRFGAETLAYDGNGNLVSRASGAMQYQYDFRNRLVRATGPSGTVENLYDAHGVKVQETRLTPAGTTTRQYIEHDGRLLEEYVNGTLDARYVRGTDVDEIVRAEQSTTGNGTLDLILYPVQDELGNVELLAGTAGQPLERYAFDGYGKFHVFGQDGQERPASAFGWRWLFQGREFVPVLGAYDFRARVLWPDLGRFNSEDPLGQAPQNLYAAFDGNWQSKRDPDGLEVTIDETYPVIDRGRVLPYNRKNGTAAHKAWQIWIRANRRAAVALGRNFYTDNWIKTIAGDLGITPFCCERTRPDAARLEHADSVTLWELKPETYDKTRFTNAGSRALLASAQLFKYQTALRMKATLGFGSELNKAHFEHDFITVIPGDDGGGYRMYAYSTEARGMIYYELEAQKKRKKNVLEKAYDAVEEFNKEAAKYGIIPVGGFAPAGGPVPVLIR